MHSFQDRIVRCRVCARVFLLSSYDLMGTQDRERMDNVRENVRPFVIFGFFIRFYDPVTRYSNSTHAPWNAQRYIINILGFLKIFFLLRVGTLIIDALCCLRARGVDIGLLVILPDFFRTRKKRKKT